MIFSHKEQEKQERLAEKANEEAKRRIAQYKTDEGVCGKRTWKEYTANPKSTGATTLLVVG